MKKIIKYYILFFLIMGSIITSCREEIDIESIAAFESALVIEARITNEYKYHEINISQAIRFEEESSPPVSNASVSIIDDDMNILVLHENNPGQYISEIEFQAEPSKSYQLKIQTANGKNYESKITQLTQVNPMDNLYAERGFFGDDDDGMFIYVDSYDPTGNSKYYLYEYEETYQIIAPYWTTQDLYVFDDPFFRYSIIDKTSEQRICYNTVVSNDIIQTQTTDLSEDQVQKFNIRFIKDIDPIISHRYSILVKQYVQSLDVFTYYKTLKKLSISENVFSQNQPGFIQGNIISVDNPNEKVIGMFEVSSVSEKRIFFDYKDFYPDASELFYFVKCEFSKPSDISLGSPFAPPLQSGIISGNTKFFDFNTAHPDPEFPDDGPIVVVTAACGDCTVFGSNIVPDFWEE